MGKVSTAGITKLGRGESVAILWQRGKAGFGLVWDGDRSFLRCMECQRQKKTRINGLISDRTT